MPGPQDHLSMTTCHPVILTCQGPVTLSVIVVSCHVNLCQLSSVKRYNPMSLKNLVPNRARPRQLPTNIPDLQEWNTLCIKEKKKSSNKSIPAATRSVNRGNESTQDAHARPSFRSSSGDLVFLPIPLKIKNSFLRSFQWCSHLFKCKGDSVTRNQQKSQSLSSLADLTPV